MINMIRGILVSSEREGCQKRIDSSMTLLRRMQTKITGPPATTKALTNVATEEPFYVNNY